MFVVTDRRILDEAERALKAGAPSPERKARIEAVQVVRKTRKPCKPKT